MTVSPSYQQRGVPNPFYTIDKIVDDNIQRLTKINTLTYRNIKEKGSLKLLGNVTGKFLFQIYGAGEPQPSYISIRKKDITDPYIPKPEKKYHKVKGGETLSQIAVKYGKTTSQLQKLNGIKDSNKINIGQQIRVK